MKKYYYNEAICKYEPIKKSKTSLIVSALSFLVSSSTFGFLLFVLCDIYYDTPKNIMLKNENQSLKTHYDIIKREMNQIQQNLNKLLDKDTNLYRTILGTEPLPETVISAGSGGVERYQNLENADKSRLIQKAFKRLDSLKSQIKVQSKSFDYILKLSNTRTHKLACTPAILPVYPNLSYMNSPFGMRIHPIYKKRIMHKGQDFAVKKGTKIFVTGNGVVKKSFYSPIGGHIIDVDHGYGIRTRYLHLDKRFVKKGDRLNRGDLIGLSGRTGTSCSGDHLHYEVIVNGKHVNPVDYFFKDLTPDQYREIQVLAKRDIQSMD